MSPYPESLSVSRFLRRIRIFLVAVCALGLTTYAALPEIPDDSPPDTNPGDPPSEIPISGHPTLAATVEPQDGGNTLLRVLWAPDGGSETGQFETSPDLINWTTVSEGVSTFAGIYLWEKELSADELLFVRFRLD